MRRFPVILVVGMSAVLSACNFFSQPADLQTENLQNEVARTQIAAVRETATVNADRLLVTLENAQTAVGNANLQSTRIAATLFAQGTLIVDTSGITPEAPPQGDVVTIPTNPIPQIANPLLTPQIGGASGDAPLVQATAPPNPQVTPHPGGLGLSNITLARQVGTDDCPLDATTTFSTNDSEIYVTAVAQGIQPQTTLHSIWRYEGTQVQDYSWTPGFAIDGACIWFLLPSSEAQFSPGNWSVEITVDGVSASAPIPFTIASSAPNEINVNN